MPALTQLLGDPHAAVRRNAAEALGNIGAAAKPALVALQKAADDADPSVQDAAAEAINQIDPTAKVP